MTNTETKMVCKVTGTTSLGTVQSFFQERDSDIERRVRFMTECGYTAVHVQVVPRSHATGRRVAARAS